MNASKLKVRRGYEATKPNQFRKHNVPGEGGRKVREGGVVYCTTIYDICRSRAVEAQRKLLNSPSFLHFLHSPCYV